MDDNFLNGWLIWPVVIFGLIVISFIPTFLAAMWEKRLIWPYVPVEEPDPRGEDKGFLVLTDYAVRAHEAAESLGFEPLGTFRDGKSKHYRVRYDFWLSPEGDVLALIGCGKIISIPVRNTWFFTHLADGRCLVTLDHQSASEFDLAGMTDEMLIPEVCFEELLDRHRDRAATSPVPYVPYSQDDPLGDHLAFMTRRVDRLEELGLAKSLNPDRTIWRYTLKGALVMTIRNNLKGIRRVVRSDH